MTVEGSGRTRLIGVAGADTCVVHLVWAPLGPGPLAAFIDSYRRLAAGAEHRLVIVLNGFSWRQDTGPWLELLDGVEHEQLSLGRPLLDLAAYTAAAERVPAGRYCFLNSYSVLRVSGWLSMLIGALDEPGAGVAGASGSWGSVSSYNRFQLGLGGPYAGIFPDRRATISTLNAAGARNASPPGADERRDRLAYPRALLENARGFQPFPAPHLRTNAFIVRSEVLARVVVGPLERKIEVYRLESGRRSITAQITDMGLSALVVGSDGRTYTPGQWPASRTLWQGEQENLLISDNRTEDYELGSTEVRTALSRYAWGHAADPAPSPGAGR